MVVFSLCAFMSVCNASFFYMRNDVIVLVFLMQKYLTDSINAFVYFTWKKLAGALKYSKTSLLQTFTGPQHCVRYREVSVF